MFIEIALQWTFNFVNQLNNEIHENWIIQRILMKQQYMYSILKLDVDD